jgi:hypothetical protein
MAGGRSGDALDGRPARRRPSEPGSDGTMIPAKRVRIGVRAFNAGGEV